MLRTSPMGWNSWDCYGAGVTEDIVRQNAEFCAKHLKGYGWEYIVVDIQWYEPTATDHAYHPFTELCMDDHSRLIPAEGRFPSSANGKGFAPLAEYVHSLGLKFGIHIMRGIPRQAVHNDTPIKGTDVTARQIAQTNSICAWNTDMYGVDPDKEGAYEYYKSIFELYASWGVDFIKCDDICREMPQCEKELELLSRALKESGDMVLSLSPGPALLDRVELYKRTSNMWRITDDFWDDWKLLYDMFDRAQVWSIHTGAGCYPDADMLPIGPIRQDYDKNDRTRFTHDEQITMMTLWSIFRSPLFIGGEMTGFDEFTMSLITNADILDMHRDARHSHQVCRFDDGKGNEIIVWTAACAQGGTYLAVFNAGETYTELSLPLSSIELYGSCGAKDLWSGEIYDVSDAIDMSIPSHGAAAFLICEEGI